MRTKASSVTVAGSARRSSLLPSFFAHLFFMHDPIAILNFAPRRASSSDDSTPSGVVASKSWNSGVFPLAKMAAPSSDRDSVSKDFFSDVMYSAASSVFMALTSTSWWSTPICFASSIVFGTVSFEPRLASSWSIGSTAAMATAALRSGGELEVRAGDGHGGTECTSTSAQSERTLARSRDSARRVCTFASLRTCNLAERLGRERAASGHTVTLSAAAV
mmetsp:Transcript_105468/g.304758  ORF Transcript_105468/g.304758 Transcript_105468/m.304758 type:complete len:219 (+) Transcript_105468:2647-3303(+)